MSQKHLPLRKYRLAHNLSCAELARKLGIAEPTVRSLENGTRQITAERAVEIEQKTGGEISRRELRPDIFGEPPEPNCATPCAEAGANPKMCLTCGLQVTVLDEDEERAT